MFSDIHALSNVLTFTLYKKIGETDNSIGKTAYTVTIVNANE